MASGAAPRPCWLGSHNQDTKAGAEGSIAAAPCQPLPAAARLPARQLSQPLLGVAEILPSGPGAAPCCDRGPGLGSGSWYSSVQAAWVMANLQGTPGQRTACGVSQEGHQGHLAVTGPTLTDSASSAKGPGTMRCWDQFLIQLHGQAHLLFADSFSYCHRPSSDMSPCAQPSRNQIHSMRVEREEAMVLLQKLFHALRPTAPRALVERAGALT